MMRISSSCLSLLVMTAFLGCGGSADGEHDAATDPAAAKPTVQRATAYLLGKSGTEAGGTAIFINGPTQVSLQIDLLDVPAGTHAVHLHEIGDCSAEDGSSAGGHWNPTHQDHGKWGDEPFHLGDIGNIEIGENGEGSLSLDTDRWSMGTGEPNDIMGKAVIVHADADDMQTQPTGNAGARISCGVVQ